MALIKIFWIYLTESSKQPTSPHFTQRILQSRQSPLQEVPEKCYHISRPIMAAFWTSAIRTVWQSFCVTTVVCCCKFWYQCGLNKGRKYEKCMITLFWNTVYTIKFTCFLVAVWYISSLGEKYQRDGFICGYNSKNSSHVARFVSIWLFSSRRASPYSWDKWRLTVNVSAESTVKAPARIILHCRAFVVYFRRRSQS